MGSFYEDNPTYLAPLGDGMPWESDTPESQGMRSAPLREGARELAGLPQSYSFLVQRNDTLVWEQYFNGSERFHSNNAHSVSKTMLGALVGIALREGLLPGLDVPVETWLGRRFSFPRASRNLTLRHLLTMTTGFQWEEDETEYEIEDEPHWVRAILNLPRLYPPGRVFNYSTGASHLLSAVLTESTGLSTHEFADRYLLGPMGITVEHWGRDPQGYYSGGYNWYVTPRELVKLGRLFLREGEWEGSPLVPSSWIRESLQPHQKVDGTYDYGYLCWLLRLQGQRIVKMWGYGGQFVYVLPDRNLVVVLTADTRREFRELDGDAFLSRYVLPALQ